MPSETVLVTGGGGFVGRHLIVELEKAWPEANILAWDLFEAKITDRTFTEVVDISNQGLVQKKINQIKPTWLVHLAANASVLQSIDDPENVDKVNVEGTRIVLESLVDCDINSRALVISSADIYGQGGELPIKELPLREALPQNPYATSKVAMEKLIEESFEENVIRARPFPHFGPGQGLGFVSTDFASQIAAIEKGDQEPVMKVGALDTTRDFTDVRDVVRAYRLLMEKGLFGTRCGQEEIKSDTCGIYNIASGKSVVIRDLLAGLLKMSVLEIKVEQDVSKKRSSDTKKLIGDAGKLERDTGWKPEITFNQTLAEVLDWWRNQPATRNID